LARTGFSDGTNANPLGNGKYQAGPAFALIYTGIKNFTVGAVNLNDGWFVGMTDYTWSFNWEDGGAVIFPLGVQSPQT
jgi:hypothetical protein